MGVPSPEGRGLAELLNRDGAASAAVTRHAAGHDEGDGAVGRSTVMREGARTAGQTLRFALGIEGFAGDEGTVTPRLAAAFRAKVEKMCAEAEESERALAGATFDRTIQAGDASSSPRPPNAEVGDDAMTEDSEPPSRARAAARLGPDVCTVDMASISGNLQFSKKSSNSMDLCVESHSNFSSCRASVCVIKGKWQYETTLETAGIQQVGWATFMCPFTNEEGVGDAQDSYAYDGKRVRKWNVNCEQYGQPWACGDVIGCCIDLDKREIRFYRNGIDLGVAFRNVRSAVSGERSRRSMLAYFPALSLSHGERCELNFGSKPFRYPVEGFTPLETPSDGSTSCRARFLTGCLGRLSCELDTTRATSSKVESIISQDDAHVAAGLIMEGLGPLITRPYLAEAELLPLLHNLNSPTGSQCALRSVIDLLSSCCEEHEFDAFVENVFAGLEHRCRTSLFDASGFPQTASYPHLDLACALLGHEMVLRSFISSAHFDIIMEGLMTRKQPNSHDLSNLMPTVWWLGAQDTVCSEERMKISCNSISISIENIEAKQREICYTLYGHPDPTSDDPLSNCFVNFARRLLVKNRCAVRNVQPPGLSDNSVLVSVYFVMLDIMKHTIMRPGDQSGPTAFPVSTFLRNDHEYFDLGRLGGTYNHVRTEFPLEEGVEDADVALSPDMCIGAQKEGGAGDDEAERPTTFDADGAFSGNSAVQLLDLLVLFFHLGVATNFKLATHQLQAQLQAINQLDDTDRRIAQQEVYSEDQLRHLKEARAVFREDVIESVRSCCWHRLGLFSSTKQDRMVMTCTYLTRLLLRISADHGKLFSYVPEAYIECVIDTFHALRRGDPPIAPTSPLLKEGLQDIITFVVKHFNDARIIHPDSRDQLLQSVSVLLQSKQYVRAFEKNEYARANLARSLLQNFDSRFWIPISNIILRLCKGRGFGVSESGVSKDSTDCASPFFQGLICDTCRSDPDVLASFLNKLFNMLNWTVTEFSVALKDIMEIVRRRQFPDIQQQQRKWTIMYELSLNLERILEFLTLELPEIFCVGDSINMTRLCEVLVFVLSHTCGPSNLFDKAKRLHLQSFEKITKESLLEPVIGIIINLRVGYMKVKGEREKGVLVPWMPAEVQQGPIESFSRRLAEMDSPEAIANVRTLNGMSWAPENRSPEHRIVHLSEFFDQLSQDTEAVKKSKEDAGLDGESDIPEAFLDPILMTLMKDPVLLPDSQQTIDRATIQRHLLSSNTDPFTRSELTLKMIQPNTELKTKIEAWQEASRKRKAASSE